MIRKLARPMLASVYIADGVNTVTKASEHAKGAEKVAGALKSVLPAPVSYTHLTLPTICSV